MKKLLTWCGTTSPQDINLADAQKSALEIFRRVEVGPTDPGNEASISVVYDDVRGNVWKFDKPADSINYRCESNGIKINQPPYSSYEHWAEDDIYDFSWSSKLPETHSPSYGDYVIFQWKSNPAASQNYPFLMRVINNRLDLIHSNVEKQFLTVLSVPIVQDQWFDIRIRVKLSRARTVGWIEFHFNGVQQLFHRDQYGQLNTAERFIGRTHDDGVNYPKWGIYNSGHPRHALTHYVDRLLIKQVS